MFQDFTQDSGYLVALALTLRLVPQALLFGGIPCQSFGYMSVGTHKRTGAAPWGESQHPFVWIGNVCATRFALLAILATVRNCKWVFEQPGGTTIHHLPPIRFLLDPIFTPRSTRWWAPEKFSPAPICVAVPLGGWV